MDVQQKNKYKNMCKLLEEGNKRLVKSEIKLFSKKSLLEFIEYYSKHFKKSTYQSLVDAKKLLGNYF